DKSVEVDVCDLWNKMPFVDGYFRSSDEKLIYYREYSTNTFSNFQQRSGLDINVTVTSFPKKKNLGKRAEISVLLRIPVSFISKLEMKWHNFMSSSQNYFWIGIQYHEEEDAWLWEDGSSLSKD
ncbi:hypothetical protein U0070_027095, partial [Myodes glareolus]